MADAPSPLEPPKPPKRRYFWPVGLSARLLFLNILFVSVTGLLSLPPLLAAREEQWLLDRVRAAELASIAPDVASTQISKPVADQLLKGAGVETAAIVQTDGVRRLVLQGPRRTEAPYRVDLRDQAPASWLAAPFQTLMGGEGRTVRVIAEPRFRKAAYVEIVAPDAELKAELIAYLWRLVIIVAVIATIAGLLVYLTLNLFLVRPMLRITRSMERFRADPDDPDAGIEPSGRRDEIGRAEAELHAMQGDLRVALNSRARLAAMGEAVAKINHDLRNMLTSAQIASERLAALKDPKVSQTLPRLERALDRAVKLATNVIDYGKTEEAAPDLRTVRLADLVAEAAEEARLAPEGVRLLSEIGVRDTVQADPDQLHRILVNLLRNARYAVEEQADRTAQGEVRVSLIRQDGVSVIRVADNGPGLSERARERLFQPFAGSNRPGGAGLGLAIARELAQGHGGDLTLAESSERGAVFEIRLPGDPSPPRPPRRRRSAAAEPG
jgi:signal transduction histidine kinase